MAIAISHACVKSQQSTVSPSKQYDNPPGCNDKPTSITVAPCLPSDVPSGAPNASLSEAGVFAWQEFIALSWPSKDQDGTLKTRGEPNTSKRLESGQGSDSSQLATWMTFRHKSEVFPGDASQPHGPFGTDAYYDDLPRYIYEPKEVGTGYVEQNVPLAAGQIPPCGDTSPLDLPENQTFITADENSQIGEDFMFAGKNEQEALNLNAGNAKGRSQILFLVKVNRAYFDYIVSSAHGDGKWWKGIPPDVRARTTTYLRDYKADPPAGSADKVSFPNGAMMVKSAWRRATVADTNSNRYIIKKVRYYVHQDPKQTYGGQPGNPNYFCYDTNYYALVGIHILQKTPSAPYFIFASFEHADNLLIGPNASPIEDENGAVIIPNQQPLTPTITSKNATSNTGQVLTASGDPCDEGYSLYYQNNPQRSGLPQDKICVRGRKHAIPSQIIDINRQAHAALDAYAAPPPASMCTDEGAPCTANFQCCSGFCNTRGFTAGCVGGYPSPPPQGSPLSLLKYYKLVNVQTAPYDKQAGVDYTQQGSGPDPSTYYMANIVVETDYPLQVFSGGFAPPGSETTNGTISDFQQDGGVLKNTLYNGGSYNMGGCMGCHGVAQSRGGGFSFAFEGIQKADGGSEGFNTSPEPAEGVPPANSLGDFTRRYDRLLQ
ncbi:hypothetical protein [Hyalangium versicolor]|uniref:hypothetical protein n=1 Tax=Hyalangium versicolor TaxID=2861190 RepID=UPI001CCB9D5B|nr:hypothetical protein [Hyalangium versicolor]